MSSVSQQYFLLSITVEIFAVVLALDTTREAALFFGTIGLVLGIVGFIFSPHDKDLKLKDKTE